MRHYSKLVRTVPTGAGIVLAILLMRLQLRAQKEPVSHSSGNPTKSSASTPVNKTPQKGDDIPCVPTPANTAPVRYTTPATPPQKHKVDLHWTASTSHPVEYSVHRCTPGGPCVVIRSVSGTSYTDDAVQSRQAYCYFVTASFKGQAISSHESAPSNILYVVIPPP